MPQCCLHPRGMKDAEGTCTTRTSHSFVFKFFVVCFLFVFCIFCFFGVLDFFMFFFFEIIGKTQKYSKD